MRWLQIVTFLPVMAFGTPPWLCCDAWVRTPSPQRRPLYDKQPRKPFGSLLGKAEAKNRCPVLAAPQVLLPAPATRARQALSGVFAAKLM